MIKPILRMAAIKGITGLCDSTIYLHIQQGLWPKGINLGPRAVGWPSDEVEAVIAARTAGKGEAEIRSLVSSLVAARSRAA